MLVDAEVIRSFLKQHNRFVSASAPDRFAQFYSLILTEITDDTTLLEDALAIIRAFVERVRLVDELIDRKQIPVTLAFSVVFPEFTPPFPS